MISVSPAWQAAQLDHLAPEGFVEISFTGSVSATFSKNDLLSFTHTQSGCMNSGELPKNSIEFSLDNSDDRWNPANPDGIGQYLSERQKLTVRYGFDINGTIEWINAGTFFLSEWRTPANGFEASFVARDVLEYMLDEPYTGITSGTLREIAASALEQANTPNGVAFNLDPRLDQYEASFENTGYKIAEILQMCANACMCVMYQDRNGTFRITSAAQVFSGYNITPHFSYTHPEFELSKPLKAVRVTYADSLQYTMESGGTGETQTVNNPMIDSIDQASSVARWVEETLKSRKNLSGEFRADPRLDVFDKVKVESKYGVMNAVVITEIKYSFNGSFRASYKGRVVGFDPVYAGYCGELYAGEVT